MVTAAKRPRRATADQVADLTRERAELQERIELQDAVYVADALDDIVREASR